MDLHRSSVFKQVTFVGVRTASLSKMRSFLLRMGYEPLHEEPDFIALRAPDGSRFELFGLMRKDHQHFVTGPVVGFEVDDIEAARTRLEAEGVEILGVTGGIPGGTRWVHFRGPDGNIYEIVHHPCHHGLAT
jgi:catechol 2,3-dioxygenase-like lactoylglutathione lyase family enzyme